MQDNPEILPIHIALIPDGNRRWAKQKGYSPWIGHIWGARSLEKILKEALDMKIKAVSFWGGSYDNLTKRPEKEIKYLLNIYAKYFIKLLKRKEIHNNQIKVIIIGRFREILPKSTLREIDKIMEETKNYNRHFLNIMIAYNGTDEMTRAIKKISEEKLSSDEITEDVVKKYLWTSELPVVDLIIRTGEEGDPHNSAGFMMWDTAYAQYYFTKTFWPDFKPEEFKKAVTRFTKRERRMGE